MEEKKKKGREKNKEKGGKEGKSKSVEKFPKDRLYLFTIIVLAEGKPFGYGRLYSYIRLSTSSAFCPLWYEKDCSLNMT